MNLEVICDLLILFIKSPGVNRPLKPDDVRSENLNHTYYRDQINKVANTIKALISGIKRGDTQPELTRESNQKNSRPALKKFLPGIGALILLAVVLYSYLFFSNRNKEFEKSIAVLPFEDLSPQNDKEYFTNGMLEEVLNTLYKIGDLKVPSRVL